jgi:integrase/recombinase XerD
MLTTYFRSVETQARMRVSCVGPHLNVLARAMAQAGFKTSTIVEHLHSAVQLARWAKRRHIRLALWDESILTGFRRYLIRRGLGKWRRVLAHAGQFLTFLRGQGAIAAAVPAPERPCSAVLSSFAGWMIQHRGVTPHTISRYRRALEVFLAALGEDWAAYNATGIRAFVVEQLGHHSRGETREAVTAIRSFLRFLVAEGRIVSGLEHCVPTVPQWSLSSLPRYLEAPDIERVIGSCDLTTGHGLRDHAVLLLLSRLGLRAGDIVGMRLNDIDWRCGTLRIQGKSRREAVLPLPQDVGDALLAYLERGRPKSDSPRVFLTVLAPTRPFASSVSVADIVRFALARAGVQNPPSRGAHLLRHSAATAMLRAGSSLETIGTVLRHRRSQTTALYAKVDLAMLQQIAQPWPVGDSC